jgi:hypothetical protein
MLGWWRICRKCRVTKVYIQSSDDWHFETANVHGKSGYFLE